MSNVSWSFGRRGPRGRRGFILLSTALLGLGLFGFLGLSIDAGYMYWVKERMQTAADSAARAGALEAMANRLGNITAAARLDASINGFTHGQNAITVTVNNPPSSGYYAGHPQAVEAIIQQHVRTFFLGVLGLGASTVRARATADRAFSRSIRPRPAPCARAARWWSTPPAASPSTRTTSRR
jgi:Flp pilus assembly protein TadG